jgi:hypothetical protein
VEVASREQLIEAGRRAGALFGCEPAPEQVLWDVIEEFFDRKSFLECFAVGLITREELSTLVLTHWRTTCYEHSTRWAQVWEPGKPLPDPPEFDEETIAEGQRILALVCLAFFADARK